jgi:hypothetical protein
MTISELISRQAASVKNGSNAIQAAEHLEAAAKLLRAESNKPVKLDFKAVVKQKQSRLDKFSTAMKEGKEKDLNRILNAQGWTEVSRDVKTGVTGYSKKAKPGYKLEIFGNRFSVKNGIDTVIDKMDINFIETYLLQK